MHLIVIHIRKFINSILNISAIIWGFAMQKKKYLIVWKII